MKLLKAILFALMLHVYWGGPAIAQEKLVFLDETYSAAFRKLGDERHSFIEMLRAGENLKGWKKLLALHRFPQMEQTPKQAAIGVASELKKRDPAARFEISENPKTQEAIVDFLAGARASRTIEFNAFKYARAPDGKGLVAVQYAERFVLGATDAEQIRRVRKRVVEAAAAFDLRAIDPWFNQ